MDQGRAFSQGDASVGEVEEPTACAWPLRLDKLEIGKDAVVASVDADDRALRQHILDMGLTPGTEVTMMKYAPMGDPLEICLRGYELTLRRADAARITLANVHDAHALRRENAKTGVTEHPAIGERVYRPRPDPHAIPVGEPLAFALAGNQNCGKTTLFNQLTGSNQHVGNFPGVTVDRKDGRIKGHPEATITDLPGIYSLSPYTSEEVVSRNFILQTRPDAIIDIVDATNIERNLYLTMQLMELDCPMVLALNMMDEVAANGGTIDVNRLESMLGIPVVPISAAKNEAPTSSSSTRCMSPAIASARGAWIFVSRADRTAVRCTAVFTAWRTLSKTTREARGFPCVLPRRSSSRGTPSCARRWSSTKMSSTRWSTSCVRWKRSLAKTGSPRWPTCDSRLSARCAARASSSRVRAASTGARLRSTASSRGDSRHFLPSCSSWRSCFGYRLALSAHGCKG